MPRPARRPAAARGPTPAAAALVAAGSLLGTAAAVAVVVVVLGFIPPLAGVYNRWAVWAATALHAWEPLAVLLPLAAVALLAYPTFADRARRVRKRWNVAVWAGVLLVTAAAFGYVVFPFGFGRLSAWVLTAAVVAAIAYVWLRANWAVTRPAAGFRKNLATYLSRSPRGETYFRLLSALYPTERVAWFDAPKDDSDADRLGRYQPGGDEGPARLVRPLGWFRGLLRRRWVARLVRPMRSPLAAPLAAHDPLLREAIAHRRAVAWAAAEEALYGKRAADPLALDDRTRDRAAAAFRDYLAATEALAECHLFNLPPEGSPARTAALRTAADLCTEAARRCLTPTLRGTHARGRAVPHHWLAGEEGWAAARRFIGLEIRCLEILLGLPAGPAGAWQRAHAFWEAKAAAPGPDLLAAARLLLAHLADRGAAQLADPRAALADPSNAWPALATAVRRGVSAAAKVDPTPFALACRQRLLDAALCRRVPQVDILREEVREMTWTAWPADAARPWQALDQWTAGLALLVAADQVAGMAREQTFRNALGHLRATGHCALRFVAEALPDERGVQQAAGTIPAAAGAVGKPPPPAVPLAELRARAAAEPYWFRRPNYFVRPWSYAAAGVAFVLTLAAAGVFRAGPVVPAPDYRLGGQALNAPVSALAAGPGDDPALWVATKGDGVHVRAPGEHHHWYRVGTADGLLSPDVYRVGVSDKLAAFVCGRDDRRGLSVAAAPPSPPGSRPWLGLANWRTILGFSGFRAVGDEKVTAVLQPPGSDILLVGTRGDGVGRYHVGERRWLDAVLDEAGGFLPPGHRVLTDLAAVQVGGAWHVWVGTENGLAGGPILGATGDDPDKAAWTVVPGSRLLSPHVAQLAVRETPAGVGVLYRTARGGVGEVVAGGGGVRHTVHVGERMVPDLEEATLRRVAYAAGGRRVWLADRPAGQPTRFSVYREGSRELAAVGPAGSDAVNDLVADRAAADRAYAATDTGVLELGDPGRVTNIGPPNAAALRVVPSDGKGIAAVTRGAAGTSVFRRDAADWQSTVGPRRVPGLVLDGVTAVEPRADGPGFFLGTKAHGVVFADPASREVYAPFPTPDPGPVRDLCVVPGAKGERDKWLLRVTDDRRVMAFDLTAPGQWRPVLNHTSGGVKPAELTAAKAFGGGLFLGSPTGLARYDINSHRWAAEPKVDGLSRMFAGAGALWAVGRDGGANALYRQTAGGWELAVKNLKAADGDDRWVAALDDKGVVWAAEKGKMPAPIFAAKPLPGGTTAPTLATIAGGKLWVAPVPGGIGQYDPAARAWAVLPAPAAELKELRGTAAGLWAVDAGGSVYLAPLAAGGAVGAWRPGPLATEADRVFFADREAVVRQRDGSVVLVRAAEPGSPRGLVGEPSPADVAGPIAAAAEFGGDLFVAAGEKLVRYDTAAHAWKVAGLPGGAAADRLVATAGHLYAADAAGRLFRLGAQDKWEDVTGRFQTAKVGTIASLGAGLGVVVPGVGVFVARDASPNEPLPVQARTPGPPADATITSAAEVGGELHLGTAAHGVWAYSDAAANGRPLPPRWTNVASGKAVAAVHPVPGDANRVVVRGDTGLSLLSRPAGGAWSAAGFYEGKALAATVTAAGAYVLTADPPTQLRYVPFQGKAEIVIGPAAKDAGQGTKSVALDPATGRLIRADAAGRVASSAGPLAGWEAEPLTAIDIVFAAAGSTWAWSAKDRALYRRATDGWAAYAPDKGAKAGVVQVVSDEKGVLARLDTGELRLLGAGGADVIVRPKEAGDFAPEWKQVARLAELGGWLLVASERGTFAYDRATHRWRPLGDEPTRAFSPTGDDRGPTGFHALGADGRVWHVAAGKDGAPARSGPVGPDEKVVRLTPAGAKSLAVTDRGSVYRIGTAAAEPAFRPGGFEAAAGPRLGAVAESQGKLALGFADGDAGRAVLYDPARAAWEGVKLSAPPVRFHATGPRLVAELEKTRALVELVPPTDTDGWTARPLVAEAVDAASADGKLWAVTPDRRVVELRPGDKDLVIGDRDAVPDEIAAAAPFGQEVVTRLADKSVWHYSLEDLAWRRLDDKLKASDLVPVGGRLYAVEDGTGKVHRYTPAEYGPPAWKLVPGAKWDGKQVEGDDEKVPDAPAPRWSVKTSGDDEKKSFEFAWKPPGDDKAAFRPVGFAERRFDFNRAAAVGHADGLLWVETKAGGKPVYRRFKSGDGYAEADTGADRFKLDPAAAKAALTKPSPLAVAGEAFRATVAPKDKPWPGRDATGDVTVELGVKVGDGFVPVRPVAAGGLMRFDLDAPTSAVSRDKTVLLGTPAGIVRGEAAGGLKRLAVVGPAADVFPGPGKAWLARTAGEPAKVLRSEDDGATWAELAGAERDAAVRAWAERDAVAGSNDDLVNWRVRVADRTAGLELKLADGAFAPVALGPGGFDFDRLIGLEIATNGVRAYTPAGRVELPRGPARATDAIDPAWAVPADFPDARAVTDPESKAAALLADGPAPRALRRDGDKWVSLDAAAAGRLRAAIGQTLLDAGGWVWAADEAVTFTGPPFAADRPLRGNFDAAAGRFTFAAPRAVQAHDGAVWVATDAGVLTFRGGKLAGQELVAAPAPGADGTAAFARAADGTWHLSLAAKGGTAAVYAFADGWKVPADTKAAEAAAKEAGGFLLRGAAWRIATAECNPGPAAPRVLHRARAANEFVRVTLRPGASPAWDFEEAAAVAGTAAVPVIGTAGGLVRLKDAGDPATTAWDFLPTRGVTRLAAEGDDLHARSDDAEERVVGVNPLRLLNAKPKRSFEERDREHLATDRWRVTKAGAATKTEYRTDPAGPWRDAGFDRGRFAFDRALDAGHAGGAAVLATPAGAVSRAGGAKGDFAIVEGLPAAKDGTAPRFFAGWREGGEQVYYRDGTAAFGLAGGKWQPLAGPAAEAALKQADTFVARGKDWDVRRADGGLAFKLIDARGTESPAGFDPRRGGFTFDFPTAVLPWAEKGEASRALVATAGGLWAYTGAGWAGLDADLDGDGKEDAVEQLDPTIDRGPLARVRTAGGVVHLLPLAPNRPRVPDAEADTLAAASRNRIDDEPRGWGVTRAAAGFALRWWGEPVELAAGPDLRFKHDEAAAATWLAGSLWVGTTAGVTELALGPDGSVARPHRPHVWSKPFPNGTVAVRRIEGNRVVARALIDGKEQALALAADRTWQPLAVDDKADPAVVLSEPGRWKWRLRSPGRPGAAVEVALDPDRFRAPAGAYPVLAGGTFAFWDIEPAAASADVVGWDGDWFVGTAGGVLRIDAASGADRRVYARALGGDPLTGITHVATDPRGGGLFVKAGGKAYRFDAGKDGFEPAADGAYPEHDRPVESAWLTWTAGPGGGSVAFKPGHSDAPPAGPLLAGGRFRFDDARQFAWRDGVWIDTPVGPVRSEPAGGGVTHHAKGLPAPDPKAKLRARDSAITLLMPDGRAYRSDTPGVAWAPADSAAAVAAREVARNSLFVCRAAPGGGFEYAFEVGDRPTFATGPGRPPVLKGGVFGFDDLRDVAFGGEELMLATRLGVWRHDPTSPTAHVPVGGAYRAAGGGELSDLGAFVRGRPGDPPVLTTRDGARAFARAGPDRWEERPPVAGAATGQRDLGPDWRLRQDGGELIVEHLRDGAVESSHRWRGPLAPGALDDAVLTPGAIWVPRERGLLWVRTRRF